MALWCQADQYTDATAKTWTGADVVAESSQAQMPAHKAKLTMLPADLDFSESSDSDSGVDSREEQEISENSPQIYTRLRHRRRDDQDADRSSRKRLAKEAASRLVSEFSVLDSLIDLTSEKPKAKVKPVQRSVQDNSEEKHPVGQNTEENSSRKPVEQVHFSFFKRSLSRDASAIRKPSKFLKQTLSARSIAMYSHLASRKNATKRMSLTQRHFANASRRSEKLDAKHKQINKNDSKQEMDTSFNSESLVSDSPVIMLEKIPSSGSSISPNAQLRRSQSLPDGTLSKQDRKDPFQVGHSNLQKMRVNSSLQQKSSAVSGTIRRNEKFLEKFKIPMISRQNRIACQDQRGEGKPDDVKTQDIKRLNPDPYDLTASTKQISSKTASIAPTREDPLQVYLDKQDELKKAKESQKMNTFLKNLGSQGNSTKSVLTAARSASQPYRKRHSLTIEIKNEPTSINHAAMSKRPGSMSAASHKDAYRIEREIPLAKFFQRKQSVTMSLEKDHGDALNSNDEKSMDSKDRKERQTDTIGGKVNQDQSQLKESPSNNTHTEQSESVKDGSHGVKHFKKKFCVPHLEEVTSTMPDKFMASDTDQSDEDKNESAPDEKTETFQTNFEEWTSQRSRERGAYPHLPARTVKDQQCGEATAKDVRMPRLIPIKENYAKTKASANKVASQDVQAVTLNSKSDKAGDVASEKRYLSENFQDNIQKGDNTQILDKVTTKKQFSEKVMTLEEHAKTVLSNNTPSPQVMELPKQILWLRNHQQPSPPSLPRSKLDNKSVNRMKCRRNKAKQLRGS
ncbi:uncharacterized protein [Ptychodera flava]|uniref:uncharacterized protein n=1 Tax=Ptychodera flava TaxID=63121 RepID=UPI00396A4950